MSAPRKRNDLRAELVKHEITVTGLAAKIGVSRSHLSDILHGRRDLTLRLARDISRESGIPMDIVDVRYVGQSPTPELVANV